MAPFGSPSAISTRIARSLPDSGVTRLTASGSGTPAVPANWSTTRLVTLGDRYAWPPATDRTALISSSGAFKSAKVPNPICQAVAHCHQSCVVSTIAPRTAMAGASRQLVASCTVDVVRDLSFVAAPGRRGSGWLEHEDRTTRRRWFVLGAPGHHEGVAHSKLHRCFAAINRPNCDVKSAIKDQEELVGVVVHVPHVLTPGVGDLYVIV